MTATVPRTESPSLRRPAVVVAAVMILGTVATVFVGGTVVLPIGISIALAGIPYTAIALVLWCLRRALITPVAPDDEDADQGSYDRRVQAFGLFSQRASLVLAFVLLGLLAIAGIGSIGSTTLDSSGPGFPVWALGGAVAAGAILTIAMNMPQLYYGRIMALERHAVATRTGAWQRIVVAWIASPVLWVAYSATSAALFLTPILR